MVQQLGLYWMGTLAIMLMFGSLLVALPRYRDGQDSLEAVIGFAFALLLWGGFAMSALGYQITTNAGVVIRDSSQMLAIFGLIGAATSFVLLLDAAMKAIKSTAP